MAQCLLERERYRKMRLAGTEGDGEILKIASCGHAVDAVGELRLPGGLGGDEQGGNGLSGPAGAILSPSLVEPAPAGAADLQAFARRAEEIGLKGEGFLAVAEQPQRPAHGRLAGGEADLE